jgi:hypothetical protein
MFKVLITMFKKEIAIPVSYNASWIHSKNNNFLIAWGLALCRAIRN